MHQSKGAEPILPWSSANSYETYHTVCVFTYHIKQPYYYLLSIANNWGGGGNRVKYYNQPASDKGCLNSCNRVNFRAGELF